MEAIAFVILAELVTIPLTAIICRRRLRRKKRVSYGTMLAGAFIASLVFVVSRSAYFNGWEVLTVDPWFGEDKSFSYAAGLKVMLCTTLMCVLPALAVVVYYQEQHLKR